MVVVAAAVVAMASMTFRRTNHSEPINAARLARALLKIERAVLVVRMLQPLLR